MFSGRAVMCKRIRGNRFGSCRSLSASKSFLLDLGLPLAQSKECRICLCEGASSAACDVRKVAHIVVCTVCALACVHSRWDRSIRETKRWMFLCSSSRRHLPALRRRSLHVFLRRCSRSRTHHLSWSKRKAAHSRPALPRFRQSPSAVSPQKSCCRRCKSGMDLS